MLIQLSIGNDQKEKCEENHVLIFKLSVTGRKIGEREKSKTKLSAI